MNKIRGAQAGFTLIELVVVIVILGILAATALPKFVDMSVEAGDAAAKATAGAISSATSINYAAKAANKSGAITIATGTACSALTPLLQGGLPTEITYVGTSPTLTCGTDGAGTGCSVKHDKGTSTGFAINVICTPT